MGETPRNLQSSVAQSIAFYIFSIEHNEMRFGSLTSSLFLSGTILLSGCAGNPLSFLPHDRDPKKAADPGADGKALWAAGKFDDSLPYFSRACYEKKDCEPYIKALLALERFRDAAPVAKKTCLESKGSRTMVCSVAGELQHQLEPNADLVEWLKPKCDLGDHGACSTLGMYLIKSGEWEASEVPLRNGCQLKKDGVSCHRLATLLWHQEKHGESIDLFQENCDRRWTRSCRWLEALVPYHEKRTTLKKKEMACKAAKEEGACHDMGVLKLVASKNPSAGLAALKTACEKYEDAESCWELFLERSELFPAEAFKSELSALCDDGIGNACRNLAELNLRLGRKKEFAELLTKGCQSSDRLSCQRLESFKKEESLKRNPASDSEAEAV